MTMRTDAVQSGNILVVDDQQVNLEVCVIMLNGLGYVTRTALNGEEALDEVAREAPGLILLDIMMPGMNGFEVCEHLKANKATADIPVIFITGLHSQKDRIKAFDVGGVDYITKPFHVTEVIARIQTHLKLRRQQEEIQQLHERDVERISQLQAEIDHRRKIEYEMRKLWHAVRQSVNGIVITDRDGLIEYANPKFLEIVDYAPAEFMGKIPPVMQAKNIPADKEDQDLWGTIRSGHDWHGTFEHEKDDGKSIWELITVSPIRDDDDQIMNFLLIQEDITTRKETEQELYRTIQHLELINDLVSATNMTRMPEQVLDIVCRELREAFEADYVLVTVTDSKQQYEILMAESPTSSQPSTRDIQVALANNPLYRYFDENHEPYTIADVPNDAILSGVPTLKLGDYAQAALVVPLRVHNRVIGILFIGYKQHRDFTQEEIFLGADVGQAVAQAAENSLLHQQLTANNKQLGQIVAERTSQLDRLNQRMAAILANITDAIILANSDGTIDMTNNRFDTLFGYFPDELFRQPIEQIAEPEYHEMIRGAFERARKSNTQMHLEVKAVRKDNTTIDIDISFAQVGNDEDHIVCSCHDITYLKEMQLIKDNFISMVTHELRTPIAGILLIANALQKYYNRMTEEQIAHKVEQLYTQSRIMAELIESVLDISRLEAQNLPTSIEQVNMLNVAQQIVEETTEAAQVKQLTLHLLTNDIPVSVEGDMVDFARIWRNLVSNAVKYTQEGGEIHIRVGTIRASGDARLILSPTLRPSPSLSQAGLTEGVYCAGQVEDNGHGIAAEDLPHLFERFHRGWAKQSHVPGTGLGLALVRELLGVYGGAIHVDSELDHGTLFTFWIPLVKELQYDTHTHR